jgi:hypothetical protein
MKKSILFSTLILMAGSLLAADSSPKDEVTAAATALGNQSNYSWHTTIASPGGGRFNGPTDGKTEKAGSTWLSMTRGDNTTEAVLQGDKGAVKMADSDWQSLAELAKDDGNGGFNRNRFIARSLQNYETPAVQVTNLVAQTKELKQADTAITGDLTDDGAKSLLTFGRRGGNGPEVSNAKGSVKFWLKDGALTKYEFSVTGTVSWNGNDRDIDRTTTVEIKDVGTTKIEVPEAAKKKL